MYVADILIAHGLVTTRDVADAFETQVARGGSLTDCLIQTGKITSAQIEEVLHLTPRAPRTVADTGLPVGDLLNLVAKTILASGEVTPSRLGDIIKLPPRVIQDLIYQAEERRLLDLRGAGRHDDSSELRYALTERGLQWAQDAMSQNQYVGPAPVTLTDFHQQIIRQRIENERVTPAMIQHAFSDLVVSERLVREIGPAVNSGQSVLLYGPSGNGKTSVGERVGSIFSDIVYIPHAFEVDGQVVKVFDPALHKPIKRGAGGFGDGASLRREEVDMRWVACRRPFVVTGGELTLEMLDLSFNVLAKYYEAPLHIKALGGVFLVDDFGRQLVSPTALLNRWIVPMESRVEYLKLHTGKSFSLPFDELVIFSTNLSPRRLMDPAFLRRIPYKILVSEPTVEEYHQIFQAVAVRAQIRVERSLVDAIITQLRDGQGIALASYQPTFIIAQVVASARFEGVTPAMTMENVALALSNLTTQEGPDLDTMAASSALSAGLWPQAPSADDAPSVARSAA